MGIFKWISNMIKEEIDYCKESSSKKVYCRTPGKPKCPICGSENIDIDSDIQWKKSITPVKCKNCGNRWNLIPIRSSVRIPLTKSARDSMATDLLIECRTYASRASNVDNISSFLEYWDTLMFKLEQLSAFEGKVDFTGRLPSEEQKKLTLEFQEKLQAAINRHKEKVISEIKENPWNCTTVCEEFRQAVSKSMPRFSYETTSYAEKASKEIMKEIAKHEKLFKPPLPSPPTRVFVHRPIATPTLSPVDCDRIIREEQEWRRKQMGKTPIEAELDRIDSMDGHTFECWCASLLRVSGFTDVEVTRSSGDQGVDVLATLDRVRYAVQCKCYSSNLGNDPVQQVYAGIAMYHCQVGSVMTNRYFTAGAKALAEATGIHLWDRDWIISLLEELESDTLPLQTE